MNIIIKICSIIGLTLSILQVYKYLYYLGVIKNKTYPQTKNAHKYAICVAARNEEKVIKNFLESVKNQQYPKEKLTVFVVADNCTDKTADIVKDFASNSSIEIILYEHQNKNERTKGFALKYLFEQINKDFGIENFEGYYVFDADNVIASNYILKMNEAFDAGNKIVTSFRNSKNIDQNWISFSYAMHWMKTCLFEHRGKNLLKLACRVQGTGFLFSNELVKNGWNYTSLTEDRAFCTDAVIKGYKIAYCEEAKFYDEQPYKLSVALKQRVRWAKGHLQSSVENCPKLIVNTFKFNRNSIISYDCFWLNFPGTIESLFRTLIVWTCQIIIGIQSAKVFGVLTGIFISLLTGLGWFWLGNIISTIFVCVFYRKLLPKIKFWKYVWLIFMSPLFYKIGQYCTYVALFKKVEWKPIPHDYTVDVKNLK